MGTVGMIILTRLFEPALLCRQTRLEIVIHEQNVSVTDLHCVLETVVELHLNAPVFCNRVQDHPQEQLPHALENSATQWDTHTFVFTRSCNYTPVPPLSLCIHIFTDNSLIIISCNTKHVWGVLLLLQSFLAYTVQAQHLICCTVAAFIWYYQVSDHIQSYSEKRKQWVWLCNLSVRGFTKVKQKSVSGVLAFILVYKSNVCWWRSVLCICKK